MKEAPAYAIVRHEKLRPQIIQGCVDTSEFFGNICHGAPRGAFPAQRLKFLSSRTQGSGVYEGLDFEQPGARIELLKHRLINVGESPERVVPNPFELFKCPAQNGDERHVSPALGLSSRKRGCRPAVIDAGVCPGNTGKRHTLDYRSVSFCGRKKVDPVPQAPRPATQSRNQSFEEDAMGPGFKVRSRPILLFRRFGRSYCIPDRAGPWSEPSCCCRTRLSGPWIDQRHR